MKKEDIIYEDYGSAHLQQMWNQFQNHVYQIMQNYSANDAILNPTKL
jgi:hypothetical protein